MPKVSFHLKKISRCFAKALIDTIKHDGIEHAGYLSFLAILSIFPFLVFLFAILGVLGEEYLGHEFIALAIDYLPEYASKAISPRILEIMNGPPQNILTIAILSAIWTASSAVEGIRTIINRAYRVFNPPAYIFRRLMSIFEFLLIIVLLITTMFIVVIMPLVLEYIFRFLGFDPYGPSLRDVITYSRYIITPIIWFFIVTFIFYYIPNIKQKFRRVIPGSITVVALWSIISSLLAVYIKNFDQFNIIYGSLASFIIALLFFYLMAMVLIFGAEFNYTLGISYGTKVEARVKKNSSKPYNKKKNG